MCLHVYACIVMYMYVYMHACVHACMLCVYICRCLCMCLCTYIYMYHFRLQYAQCLQFFLRTFFSVSNLETIHQMQRMTWTLELMGFVQTILSRQHTDSSIDKQAM